LKILVTFWLLGFWVLGHAQQDFTKKILFVLDCSGSMKEKIGAQSKFDIAIQTINHLIDSVLEKNTNTLYAVRLLGHQYHKNQNRCDDSKLILDFNNSFTTNEVLDSLSKIKPLGQTPIAYALTSSEQDFNSKKNQQNILILVTDGRETCQGDPCAVSEALTKKKIIVSPYILGFSVDSITAKYLTCIGTFINANDEKDFKTKLTKIVSQATKKTSMTIQFYDSAKQIIPNIPFTLYNTHTGEDINTYISASKNHLDTLWINSQLDYGLKIHVYPAIDIPNIKYIRDTHQDFSYTLILKDSFDLHKKAWYYDKNMKKLQAPSFQYLTLIQSSESILTHQILDYYQDPKILKSHRDLSLIKEKEPCFLKLKIPSESILSIFHEKDLILQKTIDKGIHMFMTPSGNSNIWYKLKKDHSKYTKIKKFSCNALEILSFEL
jgi:hypothetical protein